MTIGTFLPTDTVGSYATFVKFSGTVTTLATELATAAPGKVLQVVADANVSGQALIIVSESTIIPVQPNQWVGFVDNSWQVYPDAEMAGTFDTLWAPFTPA